MLKRFLAISIASAITLPLIGASVDLEDPSYKAYQVEHLLDIEVFENSDFLEILEELPEALGKDSDFSSLIEDLQNHPEYEALRQEFFTAYSEGVEFFQLEEKELRRIANFLKSKTYAKWHNVSKSPQVVNSWDTLWRLVYEIVEDYPEISESPL